jgi:hypothetical protein
MRDAGQEARDARDVHPLLRFRHRAAEDDVVDRRRLEGGHAGQGAADGVGGKVVGPGARKGALAGLADGRPHRRDDHRVSHKPPNNGTQRTQRTAQSSQRRRVTPTGHNA